MTDKDEDNSRLTRQISKPPSFYQKLAAENNEDAHLVPLARWLLKANGYRAAETHIYQPRVKTVKSLNVLNDFVNEMSTYLKWRRCSTIPGLWNRNAG